MYFLRVLYLNRLLMSLNFSFGRMDALVRHQKAEHGEGGLEKPIKPISHTHPPHQPQQPYPLSTNTNNNITPLLNPIPTATHIKSSITPMPKARKISNKRSLDVLSKMLSKNKRLKYNKSADWSSGDETEDELPTATMNNAKPLIPGSDYSQYRLARAQLHYVLRENEMLQDEYEIAQKKLKRMKTERRVLLDAVMAAEKYKCSEGEEEPIEDQDQDIHYHTKHPTMEQVLQ